MLGLRQNGTAEEDKNEDRKGEAKRKGEPKEKEKNSACGFGINSEKKNGSGKKSTFEKKGEKRNDSGKKNGFTKNGEKKNGCGNKNGLEKNGLNKKCEEEKSSRDLG